MCKGKIVLSIFISIVMCLRIGMQEEDNLEHIDATCHLFTL